MSLGFRHDRLVIDSTRYALAVRPLYQVIQQYGGQTTPTERTSTRWTALTAYWEIDSRKLYLTGIDEENDITQLFTQAVPELLTPLIEHQKGHRIFMADFSGMIAVKPRAWDGFQTSMSMSYDNVANIPDTDYEALFVIKNGKLINQITNLTCLTHLAELAHQEQIRQQEGEFLAQLHTAPTQADFYAHEQKAYNRWFRYRSMFDDEYLDDTYYDIY